MKEITACTETDYRTLATIWERSVRATHLFLSEDDIEEIGRALIPEYFPNVKLYAVTAEGRTVGFIGLGGRRIEMLFIDPSHFGCGLGSALIEFAKQKGATEVDVNEQNPRALAFYRSKGFGIVGRDAADHAGRPYPILHLSL